MSRTTSKADVSLGNDPSDDICPVCKSNRYLNPSLQFLINPECYHKMCSTCVDRIYTSGPASCPMPYCGKTLRKKGFHKAFFADLKVEREVDIRKRVGGVFNRRQEDFETLMDWNNYLEEVEGLVFELVEGSVEVRRQAEERLRKYKEGNERDIEANRRVGMEEVEAEKMREKAERESLRERRLQAVREEEDGKAELDRERRDVLERLANSNEDPAKIKMQAQKVILKKSSARRALQEPAAVSSQGDGLGGGLSFRGLKQKKVVEKEKAYDPFGGIDFAPSRYVLQKDYNHEPLYHAKKDVRHTAGGYSLKEYYSRTLFEAFSGFGVFIDDEVAGRDVGVRKSSPGLEAAEATGRLRIDDMMEIDDVF